MRAQVLALIAAVGLIASATAATDPGQAATWAPRKLLNFSPPVGPTQWAGPLTCDELVAELSSVLLDLGARPSDLQIDERGCRSERNLSVDATFSVLAPSEQTAGNAAGAAAEARWQTVELRTGRAVRMIASRQGLTIDRTCDYLQYVTKKVLPLFSIRDAKEIPRAVCDRVEVGLRAQVLMAPQQLAATP